MPSHAAPAARRPASRPPHHVRAAPGAALRPQPRAPLRQTRGGRCHVRGWRQRLSHHGRLCFNGIGASQGGGDACSPPAARHAASPQAPAACRACALAPCCDAAPAALAGRGTCAPVCAARRSATPDARAPAGWPTRQCPSCRARRARGRCPKTAPQPACREAGCPAAAGRLQAQVRMGWQGLAELRHCPAGQRCCHRAAPAIAAAAGPAALPARGDTHSKGEHHQGAPESPSHTPLRRSVRPVQRRRLVTESGPSMRHLSQLSTQRSALQASAGNQLRLAPRRAPGPLQQQRRRWRGGAGGCRMLARQRRCCRHPRASKRPPGPALPNRHSPVARRPDALPVPEVHARRRQAQGRDARVAAQQQQSQVALGVCGGAPCKRRVHDGAQHGVALAAVARQRAAQQRGGAQVDGLGRLPRAI